MLREIFLGIFNRSLSSKGPEYQRLFLFQLNQLLLETDYSSEASKQNINILLLPAFTHGFFPAEAIENHDSLFTENLSKSVLQRPNLRQKVQKRLLFSKIGFKQGKMGTETSKIALN